MCSSSTSAGWGSRPCAASSARRSSRPWGWERPSSINTSPTPRPASAGRGLPESPPRPRPLHRRGFPIAGRRDPRNNMLDVGVVYHVRVDGERHLWTPESIYTLQAATRMDDYGIFKKYTSHINDQAQAHATLRSLFRFREGHQIPIAEGEPAEKICTRFVPVLRS